MPPARLFGISVLLSFVIWSVVAVRFLWPALRRQPRPDALRPILLLHSFRFIGLAFLIPGVVSPNLPQEFAVPAAYGDLAAALLAIFSLFTLGSALEGGAVWIFNIVGTADLLFAFYQGRIGVGVEPGLFGAAYFIPTVVVPLLLVTHVIVFRLLLRRTMPSNLT
jgi:hypothetical protein